MSPPNSASMNILHEACSEPIHIAADKPLNIHHTLQLHYITGYVFSRSGQPWAGLGCSKSFFIVSGTTVSRFLIVLEKLESIQKRSGLQVCKAGAAWEERVASHHISQSNMTVYKLTKFDCLVPDYGIMFCAFYCA